MIWKVVWSLSVAASATTFCFIVYEVHNMHGRPDPLWPALLLPPGLFLNVVYLMFHHPIQGQGRLLRLVGLWLDAKEAELRKRADTGNSN